MSKKTIERGLCTVCEQIWTHRKNVDGKFVCFSCAPIIPDISDTNVGDMPARPSSLPYETLCGIDGTSDTPSKEKKYPIGGFAPGNYQCFCVTCKGWFTGDKRAVQCEPCAEKVVAEWAVEQLSAPSKEGVSQSPIPEEITKWAEERISRYNPGAIIHDVCLDMATAMYHKLMERREAVDLMEIVPGISPQAILQIVQLNLTQLRDYEKALFVSVQEVKALQSQLSSMKAERDQALKDLTEDARLWDVAQKDHELAIQEGQKWKDESNTLSALLEGKNLEIAQLEKWVNVEDGLPEIGQYVLVYASGGRCLTSLFKDGKFFCYDIRSEELEEAEEVLYWMPMPSSPTKYKKEEQK